MDNEEELARVQSEIEKRHPKIAALHVDKKEIEEKSQALDYDVKGLRICETEIDAEMGILATRKTKLLSEKVK